MKTSGKLIYSPRTHLSSSDHWLVLMADDDISRYYRHLYSKDYPYLNGDRSTKLTRPVWGTHVSVIRGEKIPNLQNWKLDDGKIVEFDYEAGVIDNGEYYWLKVSCPYLSSLRQKMGLSKEPRFGFHLTIGRKTE